MFGAFNLRSDNNLFAFQQAFDAFCEHLKEADYLKSWRLWERAYHEGYDMNFSNVSVLLEMRFHDHKSALDAWDYVESKSEPMHRLHVAMNTQITNTHFVLCNEK